MLPQFYRSYGSILETRLHEPRRFLQIISGPRQVGKPILARQALSRAKIPHRFASADEPALKDAAWLSAQWEASRLLASNSQPGGSILALDEIQKITGGRRP